MLKPKAGVLNHKFGVLNHVANRCHSLLNRVQVNFLGSEDVKELYRENSVFYELHKVYALTQAGSVLRPLQSDEVKTIRECAMEVW